MAIELMIWLIAIPLLGVATGLRSMTPMAVLCWFAHLGYLPVDGTWAQWTQHLWLAILLTVCAAGEDAADKYPWMPSRLSPPALLWRVVLGALAGCIAATALNGSGLEGVLLGVVGALLGAFCGFMIRRDLVQKLEVGSWPIAFAEDLLALVFALFAMHVVTA
jgi:uncharacterized membrane protein